jgi:predicted transcriptional regulator
MTSKYISQSKELADLEDQIAKIEEQKDKLTELNRELISKNKVIVQQLERERRKTIDLQTRVIYL